MPTEIAYAKINLALHVRRRREDGYHELETLFAFVDVGDEVTADPAEGFSLKVIGPFAQELSSGEDNLVLRAARLLAERNKITSGAAFTLNKRLPVAAGIGGGSADAAAALRLCARLWGLYPVRQGEHHAVEPSDVAAELGADVPACVASQSCFGSGVGDRLVPIDGTALSGLPILLVNPRVECLTGPVFKAWDGMDRGPLAPDAWFEGRNDLQRPALALHPKIGDVLVFLRTLGARLVRMSGSGATCFALFDYPNQRDKAAIAVVREHPEWWTLAGKLR